MVLVPPSYAKLKPIAVEPSRLSSILVPFLQPVKLVPVLAILAKVIDVSSAAVLVTCAFVVAPGKSKRQQTATLNKLPIMSLKFRIEVSNLLMFSSGFIQYESCWLLGVMLIRFLFSKVVQKNIIKQYKLTDDISQVSKR